MSSLISLNQLYHDREKHGITWVKSTPTFYQLVKRDLATNNVLKTVVMSTQKSTKYFVPVDNVPLFVKAFIDGTLFKQDEKANQESTEDSPSENGQ